MSARDEVTDIDDGASRRAGEIARSLTLEDRISVRPPADLWDSIATALEHEGPSTFTLSAAAAPVPSTDAAAVGPDERSNVSGTDAAVLRLRRRTATWVLSAAAAVVLVAGAVALLVTGTGDEPAGDLVATAELDSLEDGFSGVVELIDVDGRFELSVAVGDLPPAPDGYYELWLIKDLETGEMQSLGPIEGGEQVVIPAALDPAQYATVDISVEPLDGVPTHSGQSVLRGAREL